MTRRTADRSDRRDLARVWTARTAVLAGVACIVLAVVAPPVGANYGRVSASAGCDRSVNWTATASTEGTAAERTNRDVLVEYRPADESSSEWFAAGPPGHFDESNGFEFSGSFDLPDGHDAVTIRVTAREPWGPDAEGEPPGEPRFARASIPDACADQAMVATIEPDCASRGARVAVGNVGDDTAVAELSVDSVVLRRIDLGPGDDTTLIVPVLDGRPTKLRVSAGDFVIAERRVNSDCDGGGPADVVVLERCGPLQAVVLAGTGGAAPVPVQIRVDGAIVSRTEVRADQVLQRTMTLPGPGASDIEVELDGRVVLRGQVGGCNGPVTGVVRCDVGATCAAAPTTTAVPPPPPPPESLNIEISDPLLPRTGPWERAIALGVGGVLLSAGGVSLRIHDRRRPRASFIAGAIAPYRQRWWDDF